MALYLGVDGGQSSTTALIGDENGSVLGTGTGGPANHVEAGAGREKLKRAVGESLGLACDAAGLDAGALQFEAACFGMSGGPADKQGILSTILPTKRLIVTDDALIALAGATGGGPGVVTIAGTGSIAFGRNAAGVTARAGGWGYLFGDEGSAYDIARQALRAALRYEEGWGPATALHSALIEAGKAADANDLMHLWYTDAWPRARIALLAKLVDEAANEGDAAARDIVNYAAQELATLAGSVRRRLFATGEKTLICYVGGVFKSKLLLSRFRQLIELEEGSRVAAPRYGPAAGALLEAYRSAGMQPQLSNLPEFKA